MQQNTVINVLGCIFMYYIVCLIKIPFFLQCIFFNIIFAVTKSCKVFC